MKYKRTQKRSKQMWQRVEKFSIRKFSFGAASCLIGASLVGVAGTVQPVEATISTFRDQKGGNVTTLYANQGDNPFEAGGSGVYDKVNVDQEIGIEIDWSEYSKTNPYVTVTYKYNGGYGTAALNNYGGGRPDFWFTTPVGVSEPKTITLYNLNTDKTGRTITSWSGEQGWVSFSNSVGSRYQNKEMADKLGVGDPTKWERYNDATGEDGRTYRGDLNTMFWRRIGDNIEGSPSEQGIYQSFRDNTKSMYSDWQKAADPTATIKATYKVVDPTLKNGKLVLEFGAGVKVGHGGSLVTHFKTLTVEVPVLYQDSELFEVKVPQRTGVVNAQELTETEKADIKSKILKANEDNISSAIPVTSNNKFKDNLKDGENSIVIGNDGTATITYLDGSKDTIPGTSLVYEKPQIDNNETTQSQFGDYKYLTNPFEVDDINNLKNTDVESAKLKFYTVNNMMVEKNEFDEDVIKAVGEPLKTSPAFVNKRLEIDKQTGLGYIYSGSGPTGAIIPKAHLFKQKPKKTFNIDEARQDAEKAIENLTYLSPKEKQNFKTELASKTTQDELNTVVNNAIAKNSSNEKALEAKKREIKDAINKLKYLTKEEKDGFINRVNNQAITDPADGDGTGTKALDNTKTLLDNILTNANAKNLEEAKKQAKAEIEKIKDDLTNPTADNYKEQIQAAGSTDAVEKIVENAKNQKASKDKEKEKQKADALKDEYKKKIDQIPGLSEADKTEYKKQIEAATSKNQLDNIIKDAEAKATRNKAIETITNLPHLNNAQKADLIEQVKDATDKEEIEDVVTKAQGLDAKMDSLQQLVTKANDVKNTDKYTNATSGTKTSFDTALTNADAVANKETGKEADASEVDSLIDKLKEAIKNLTGEEVAKPVSKAALQAEVNKEAEVHKSTAYLKDTKAKQDEYDKALNEAKTVLADDGASQESIDAALDKLQKARAELAGQAADFTLAVKDGAAKISVVPKVGESLTEQADKDAVKAKVTANGEALKATDTVTYGAIADKNGKKVVSVIVTRDGVSKTINVEVTKKAEELTLAVKDETKPAKISKVPVAGESLTAEDEAKVKEKVTANGEALKATDTVKYGTIAEKDGKKVVPVTVTRNGVEKTVDVPVEGTDAAKSPLNDPEKVKVNDVSNLSEDEKAAVKAAVKKANTNLTDAQISVDNTGKVTVTYSDKSQNELPASKTVEVKTEAEKALDKAKEKAKSDLTEAANKEKAEIEADKNLTEDQKKTEKDKVDKVKEEQEKNIDKATTPEDVTKATEDGKKAIAEVHQTELDKAKEQAKSDLTEAANKEKAEIESDKTLTEDQKKAEKAKVDEAKKAAESNIDKAGTTDEVAKATEAGKKAIDAVHKTNAEQATPNVKDSVTAAGGVPVSVDPANAPKVAEADKKEITEAVEVPKDQPQPKDKQVKNDGKIVNGTGANEGKKVVVVEVTYPDGSKDEIEVPVRKATDQEKAKADLTKAADAEKAEIDEDNALSKKEKEALKKQVDELKAKHEENINNATSPEAIATATEKGRQEIAAVHTPQDITETAKRKLTPPKEKVKVTDVNHLTDEEKEAVKKAIVATNPQLEESEVYVSDKGDVASPKGYLEAEKVVVQALNKPATPVVVADPNRLTNDEKEKVKEAVANANPGLNKDDITVDDKGNVTTKNGDKLLAKDVVTPALNKPTTPVVVGNPNALTEKEKEDIKDAVAAANPGLNKGDVTVNPDGSVTTPKGNLPKEDVVVQTAKGQSTSIFKPELDLQTALVSGKATVEKGKDLTDEEILKQLALADGVTAKVISKPTTTEKGTKEAEVEVTLADGTKVTVKVPVEVVDSLGTADKDNDLAKAKEDAKKQVEDAAKKKLDEIKKDKDLTEEQKQKAEETINKAKEDANKAIDEASSAGTAKQIADQAKENIEKYDPKADAEVKKPDVTNLDEEKAKAKAEILEEAQKRINEIKNNKDLSDEAKQKAIKEINKAKDKAIEDINKGQSKDEINAAKEAGIHKINEVQPDGSIASKFEPKVPENKVEVGNPAKLSDEEREQVRQNIEGANTFPDGTTVEVKPDGTAVITYKDGSTDTISKDKLVAPANKETETIASRTEPVIPGKTQVGNTTKLTPEEQATVKKAVEEANNFPAGTTVEVRPDGTVVITYPDKSVDTITGDKLVEKGSKQETPKVQTDAEKNPAQVPGNFVPVENTHNLTQTEQDTVAAKVKEANPAATDVKVSKDGTATLTYGDGSVNTIPGTSLVVAKDTDNEASTQAAQNPAVVPATTEVGNAHSLTPEEQAAVTTKVKQANPTATDVKVSKDGTATLTYSDGSVNTIPGTSLVVQKEETSTQEQPTIAEKTKVIIPANPTKVAEATRLTDEEKEAVKKAVVDANGFGSDVKVEVAGDGTATIVFKDGSAITIPGNQLVAQDPKAQDSTKPTAEKLTVKAPAQRVDVKDITHLTDEEKEKVKVAILQANGSALDGATINVAGDGTATITFPDGSVVTILGKDTVQQSAKGESVTQEDTPEYKPETTPGGDNGGNTGSSDANVNAGGGSQAGGQAHTGSQTPAQSQASKQLATEKESAKNAIEKAAKDKQDEIKGAPLSDKEKAELLARVEAEKQAALKEIENAKTVEDVKEAETIGVQAIAMVTVPKRPVAPNAAPQATSAPQATAGTMQDVTYQSPAGKQLPNTGSASSAALASLGLVAATSGFALLGRKARRRK